LRAWKDGDEGPEDAEETLGSPIYTSSALRTLGFNSQDAEEADKFLTLRSPAYTSSARASPVRQQAASSAANNRKGKEEHHDEERPATLRDDIKNEGVLRGGLHWIKDHTPGHHHAQGADTLGAPGPAWTRGELERPADTHDMGRWTRAVYSEEQQQRLAVDETGQPRGEASVPQMAPRSTTADEFGWTAQRSPSIVGTESLPGAPAGAPIEFNIGSPRGEFNQQPVEEPEGLRDLGYRSERFYTTEQQDRLGVDDIGRPLSPRSTIPGVYAVNAEGLGNSSPVASGTLRAWMQEQEWRTRHVYSQGPT